MDPLDVIVVGGGAAGCTAAITAHDAGARVLLLEAEATLGGSTARSGGYVFAAGTATQQAAGVDDDAEAMFAYASLVNRWQLEASILRVLCERSASAVAWLESLGVEFRPEDLVATGMETVRRGHRARGEGAAIATALERACRARDLVVAVANPADALVVEGGRVVGVRAGDHEARAAAVVLASGGFAQHPDLLARHFPSAAAAGAWSWSLAGPGSRGFAVRAGEQVGASFAGHDRGLVVPVPCVGRSPSTATAWITLVDPAGRRFIAEDAYHSVLAEAILRRGGRCLAVFDEASRPELGGDGAYGDLGLGGAPPEVPADGGLVWRADSVEGLARATGADPRLLARTLTEVNDAHRRGIDEHFGKSPVHLRPVTTPPLWAVEVRPAMVALTGYGVRIDPDGAVLDGTDGPIPGLFAAGEATGNVLGELYIGSGSSLTGCVVFGQRAGRAAALSAARGRR